MDFRPMTDEEIKTFDLGLAENDYEDEEEDRVREYKNITLRELAQAIRQNGVAQERGKWFDTGERKEINNRGYFEIKGGCALGQAGINLGISPNFEFVAAEVNGIPSRIISMNDDEHLSLEDIAATIEKDYADYLDFTAKAEIVDYSNGVPEYVLDSF